MCTKLSRVEEPGLELERWSCVWEVGGVRYGSGHEWYTRQWPRGLGGSCAILFGADVVRLFVGGVGINPGDVHGKGKGHLCCDTSG